MYPNILFLRLPCAARFVRLETKLILMPGAYIFSVARTDSHIPTQKLNFLIIGIWEICAEWNKYVLSCVWEM